MLGLGDIVIPGMFVATALRYDYYRASRRGQTSDVGKPYFYSTLTAYAAGLATTMSVMHFFRKAQPALLYLRRVLGLSKWCLLQDANRLLVLHASCRFSSCLLLAENFTTLGVGQMGWRTRSSSHLTSLRLMRMTPKPTARWMESTFPTRDWPRTLLCCYRLQKRSRTTAVIERGVRRKGGTDYNTRFCIIMRL